MNIGRNILELRKQKNIKQEELAAELGVTAAAVSKWENGYTLPDILMLCALADYFRVTADELLGRNGNSRHAVIATDLTGLQADIKELIESHDFRVKYICSSIQDARDAASSDPSISHIFASFSTPLKEEEYGDKPKGTRYIECHSDNKAGILEGFKLYLQNRDTYDALAEQEESK